MRTRTRMIRTRTRMQRVEPKEYDGATLFQTSKGWQFSTRERDQVGWSIKIISNAEAQEILNAVQNLRENTR